MSKLAPGVVAPLFDRLDQSRIGREELATLDSAGLQASLLVDLRLLFSARSSLTVNEYLAADLNVIHYGLPDLSHLSAQSESEREQVRDVLLKCIGAFEPRLFHVVVKVEAVPQAPVRAMARISAAVHIGQQWRRVEFDMAISRTESAAEISAVSG